MSGFSVTELFFYGGIATMVTAVVLAILCIIIFSVTGKQIRRKLEQDYGKIPYAKPGRLRK
ncbi:MAG: hypothetical protein IJ716_11490 [Lachnospiraceae bacterium]|nr:hypothetical protein [Lachnospiraceae bacterium]